MFLVSFGNAQATRIGLRICLQNFSPEGNILVRSLKSFWDFFQNYAWHIGARILHQIEELTLNISDKFLKTHCNHLEIIQLLRNVIFLISWSSCSQ